MAAAGAMLSLMVFCPFVGYLRACNKFVGCITSFTPSACSIMFRIDQGLPSLTNPVEPDRVSWLYT